MPTLEPVDHDPFAAGPPPTAMDASSSDRPRVYISKAEPKLEPVDHDPFAADPMGIAKQAGVGLAKGAIGLAGLPGDTAVLAKAGADKLAEKLPDTPSTGLVDFLRAETAKMGPGAASGARGDVPGTYELPTSQDIQGQVEKVTGPFRQPQNQTEADAQTVGEFVPAALMGPGGVVRKAVTQVALPAASTIVAGRFSDQNPYVKALAGFVGGGAGALMSGPGSAEKILRNQLPEFVTEAHIDRAGRLIEAAKNRGIDLTWPEALTKVTGQPVLTGTQRILESHAQTRPQMESFFADRPQQVEGAARDAFDSLGSQHPNPSMIGPESSATATGVLNNVRSKINAASDQYYKNAEAQLFTPAEFSHITTIPGYKESLKAVRDNPQINWRIAHLPDNSVGVLNEVKKHFDQAAENAASKFNPSKNRQVQSSNEMAADAARQIGIAKSADYEIALEIQKQARERYLEPLLKGPLGQLAKKDVTTQRAIDALFQTNPLPGSEGEIRNAVYAIAQKRPAVAEQLVRSHAEMVFNEAAKELQGGANQFAGAKFAVKIAGNSQQKTNLQAAIEALPNGTARWEGFEKLLDIVSATGARQPKGSLTAFNDLEVKAMSGSGLAALAAKGASPAKWWSAASDAYKSWSTGRNLDQLATILTSPRSAGALKLVSRIPPSSDRAAIIAGGLVLKLGAATTDQRAKTN